MYRIYFAIWDIGEFTESRSRGPARVVDLVSYPDDSDIEYEDGQGGVPGEGSAKTKKKNAARRRAKKAKKAAAAEAEAEGSKEGQGEQQQ